MTFKTWLATTRNQPPHRDAEDELWWAYDFIMDAKSDAQLPDVVTWQQLHDYLAARGVGGAVILGANVTWMRYKHTLDIAPNSN